MEVFGLAITGVLSVLLFLLGLFALIGKGTLGTLAKSLLSVTGKFLPVVAIALIVISIGGAATTAQGWISSAGSTASLNNIEAEDQPAIVKTNLACRFDTAPTEGTPGTQNITFRADDSALNNYYVDVKYESGGHVVNGSLYCEDDGVVNVERAHTCYAKSDVYRDQLASDSTDYYWVATTNSVSIVPGLPWKQLIDLADKGTTNSPAVASDPDERTPFVFGDGEKYNYLGFNLTLFDTQAEFDQLKNQSSGKVRFICDDVEAASLTIVRATA